MFTIKDVDGTTLVILMNQSDICISAGSACSSGSGEPSHVLKAIGKSDEDAFDTIRITLCSDNTKEEIDEMIEVLKANVIELRRKVWKNGGRKRPPCNILFSK